MRETHYCLANFSELRAGGAEGLIFGVIVLLRGVPADRGRKRRWGNGILGWVSAEHWRYLRPISALARRGVDKEEELSVRVRCESRREYKEK